MPMKKQPEGIKRVPRGDRKVDEHGKKLPADAYDIMLVSTPKGTKGELLGWTERMSQGKWNAHAITGEHLMLAEDHTAAVAWLLDAFHGHQKTSEGSTTEEGATVAPSSDFGLDDMPVSDAAYMQPVFMEPVEAEFQESWDWDDPENQS